MKIQIKHKQLSKKNEKKRKCNKKKFYSLIDIIQLVFFGKEENN
jgi:hypothetical protein